MIETVQIERFLAIYKYKSFAKAAASLRITEPTISKSMRSLQDELHVRLFRPGKNARLTLEGENFLVNARQIMQLIQDTQKEARSHSSLLKGKLTLGCVRGVPAAQKAVHYVAKFHRLFPDIDYEIITEGPDTLSALLQEGICDAAILLDLYLLPWFDAIPLFQGKLMALIPEDDPLAENTECIEYEQLVHRELIVPPAIFLNEEMETWMKSKNVRFHIRCVAASSVTVTRLIREGLGIGLFPESIDDAVVEDHIRKRTLTDHGQSFLIPYSLAWSSRRPPSACLERFLELVQSEISANANTG